MRSFLKPLFFLLLGATFFCLPSCKDECDGVVCYNGGVCDDGKCGCPLNYIGENCETKVESSNDTTGFNYYFLKVEILDFPDLKDGKSWDDSTQCDAGGALPDIYFTIEAADTIIFTSSTKENCNLNTILSYQDNFPLGFNNAFETFVIRLYDADNGQCAPREYMGGIQGKLYDNLSQIQDVRTFSNPAVEIEVRIFVQQ